MPGVFENDLNVPQKVLKKSFRFILGKGEEPC